MKKLLIIVASVAGLFYALYLAGRLTGALAFYSVPAGSMQPAIMPGQRIIVSNLAKPERNKIIVLERKVTEFDGINETGTVIRFVSRLIAKGGDRLEIRDGFAYVNGKFADDSSRLRFDYLVPGFQLANLVESLKLPEEYLHAPAGYEDVMINLSTQEYHLALKLASVERQAKTYDENSKLYGNDEKKRWTIDKYGPVTIPANHYFVLGDNRHAALDSRYLGPIPASNYLGNVID